MLAKLWEVVAMRARIFDQTPTPANLAALREAELAYRLEVEANMR